VTGRRERLRYGGAWFSAASGLPLDGGLTEPRRLTRLLGSGLSQPRRLIALLAFLLGAPKLDVRLSASSQGRLLQDYFSRRFLGVFPQSRLCRAVLVLPSDAADYLRGRDRHALRNNLGRARRAGIGCSELDDPTEALTIMQAAWRHREPDVNAANLASMSTRWSAILGRPEVTMHVARGPAGEPLGVVAGVIDEQVCLLRTALATTHEARWALHQHLVRELIDRRVRYLISHDDGPFGALALDPSLHYYQQLLGYQVCHIRPVGPRRRARSTERHPLR